MIAGTVNIFGPRALRSAYVAWGYPAWFHRVSGGLDLLASMLMMPPSTTRLGLALALVICAAALLTLARHREWKKTPSSLFLSVLVGYLLLTSFRF
ncbi:DoxX family protein [Caballeronia sp. DA-9]|uniref:DoxX family protein n=1 Tax=Caballeronia sp. DA-9 TaxID=3436237 RepID=UPI003F663E7F